MSSHSSYCRICNHDATDHADGFDQDSKGHPIRVGKCLIDGCSCLSLETMDSDREDSDE